MPNLGKRHEEVARFLREPRKTFSFVAHDKHHFAFEVSLPDMRGRLFAGACNPEASLFQRFTALLDVGNLGDGHARDGAGAAFVRGGRHMGAAFVGNDNTGGANRFGRPDDGAEIACVRDVVEQDD